MCGIAGFTHRRIVPERGRIQDALGGLIDREAGSSGVYESVAASLGAAGSRPLASSDGDTVVVFHGALYNRGELAVELEHRGHRLLTGSDAETLLAAFRQWDTGCFARLRGMFAVALWSDSARRLVLARDRMGIQPLYLARHCGEMYFGSELEAIFAHPEIDRRLSLAGLDCYLSLNYLPCPWTLAEGVEKLPPAHWLEWRDGAVRSQAYWRLPDAAAPQPFWTLESARSELDSLLKQSMREHLRADAPVVVWLNGAIDSSTALHYAASAASGPLRTFSIGSSDSIRQLVAEYGTVHQQLDWSPQLDPSDIAPGGDAAALPFWLMARSTRRADFAALAGAGCDELFGGRPAYRGDAMARRLRRFPRPLLRLAAPFSRRFLEGCLLPPEQAHVYWTGALTPAQKRALAMPLPPALRGTLADLAASGPSLPAWLAFDQRYYLPDNLLAYSAGARQPFLDHRIVEFAAALPAELKMRGSQQNILPRELMKGKLPADILRGRRPADGSPVGEWLRGAWRALLVDTIEAGASENADVFHAPFLRECLRRHLERRADFGQALWGMMLLFLWMKRWRIQTIPPPEAGLEATPSIFTSV